MRRKLAAYTYPLVEAQAIVAQNETFFAEPYDTDDSAEVLRYCHEDTCSLSRALVSRADGFDGAFYAGLGRAPSGQAWAPEPKVAEESASQIEPQQDRAYWRERLLTIEPGVPTWLNGVPVTREPCEGKWFRVGVHHEHPEGHCQRLRLGDAVERVHSGYYPTAPNPPTQRRECSRCLKVKSDRWDGAFSWCAPCAKFIFLDCHNDHGATHADHAARLASDFDAAHEVSSDLTARSDIAARLRHAYVTPPEPPQRAPVPGPRAVVARHGWAVIVNVEGRDPWLYRFCDSRGEADSAVSAISADDLARGVLVVASTLLDVGGSFLSLSGLVLGGREFSSAELRELVAMARANTPPASGTLALPFDDRREVAC